MTAPGPDDRDRAVTTQSRMAGTTRRLERGLGDWARARLPGPIRDLAMFTLKMGWSALFGGLLLGKNHKDLPLTRKIAEQYQ